MQEPEATHWLDTDTLQLSTTAPMLTASSNLLYTGGNSSSYVTYTWPTPTKIQLTLSEVETLRAHAKRSKKLKAALRKFGPYIEIVVDFP